MYTWPSSVQAPVAFELQHALHSEQSGHYMQLLVRNKDWFITLARLQFEFRFLVDGLPVSLLGAQPGEGLDAAWEPLDVPPIPPQVAPSVSLRDHCMCPSWGPA